jgi:hypothetical protein
MEQKKQRVPQVIKSQNKKPHPMNFLSALAHDSEDSPPPPTKIQGLVAIPPPAVVASIAPIKTTPQVVDIERTPPTVPHRTPVVQPVRRTIVPQRNWADDESSSEDDDEEDDEVSMEEYDYDAPLLSSSKYIKMVGVGIEVDSDEEYYDEMY